MVDENNENAQGPHTEKRESQRLSKATIPPAPPPPLSSQAKKPKTDGRNDLLRDIQNANLGALKKAGAQTAPLPERPRDDLAGVLDKKIAQRKSARQTKTSDEMTLDGFFKKNRQDFLKKLRPLDPDARKLALREIKGQWNSSNKNDDWADDSDIDAHLNDLTRILALEDENKLKALQDQKVQEKRMSAEQTTALQASPKREQVPPAPSTATANTDVEYPRPARNGLNAAIEGGVKLRPVSVTGKKRKISPDEVRQTEIERAMQERRAAVYNEDEEDESFVDDVNPLVKKAVSTSESKRRSVMAPPPRAPSLSQVVSTTRIAPTPSEQAVKRTSKHKSIPAPSAQLPVIPSPAVSVEKKPEADACMARPPVARYSSAPKPEEAVSNKLNQHLKAIKDLHTQILADAINNFEVEYKTEHAKKRKWIFIRNKDSDIKEIKQKLGKHKQTIENSQDPDALLAALKKLDEFIEAKMKRFNPEKRSSVGTVLQHLKDNLKVPTKQKPKQ